jgi:molybdate transport system substrate-binding protein
MTLRPSVVACLALVGVALAAVGLGCSKKPAPGVTVAAAASLRHAMPELVAAFEKRHPGAPTTVTYGASGQLRRQVEGGAPVDLVVFASGEPVDALVTEGRAERASRRVLATNELVLVGPKGARPLTFATLTTVPPGERVAVGDPRTVPAGSYARAALEKLGEWDALRDRLVFGGDVSAVLAYARRGEVVAAIVYATEARGIDDIVVLDTLKGPAAPRAEVVEAVVAKSPSPERARALADFLATEEAQRIVASFGFSPP